jgi:hypothetical protein
MTERVLTAHDPSLWKPGDLDGVDVLVRIHDDGSVVVATRPGHTGWTWGPPVTMTEADQ